MRRKLVQAGGSLAVTLPAEVVQAFKLVKGMEVDVSVHPRTGAVVVRLGVEEVEGGRVTRRFARGAKALADRHAEAFEELAK